MNVLVKWVGLVRDVLLIIVLTAVLFFGWHIVKVVGEVNKAGEVSKVAPLPQDRCGGGIC